MDDPVNGVDPLGLMGVVSDLIDPLFPDAWQWQANEGACDKCQKLAGTIYLNKDDAPEKPHPNCKCQVVECEYDTQYGDWKVVSETVIMYRIAGIVCFGAKCTAAWHQISRVEETRKRKVIRTCGASILEIENKNEKRSRKTVEVREAPAIAIYQGGDPEGGDVFISTNPWNPYDSRSVRKSSR